MKLRDIPCATCCHPDGKEDTRTSAGPWPTAIVLRGRVTACLPGSLAITAVPLLPRALGCSGGFNPDPVTNNAARLGRLERVVIIFQRYVMPRINRVGHNVTRLWVTPLRVDDSVPASANYGCSQRPRDWGRQGAHRTLGGKFAMALRVSPPPRT